MSVSFISLAWAFLSQRASAELSESGRALKHRMTLPVLPQTGVITPGMVLRYADDAAVHLELDSHV